MSLNWIRSLAKLKFPKKKPEQGFTLIEIVVAMAIMAAGFVLILRVFSGSVRSLDLSSQYMKGVALANHKMGELELLDFEVEEASGTFPEEEEDSPEYRWELIVEPFETPLTNEKENIRVNRVTLRVLWGDIGTERNLELVSLKTMGKTYPSSNDVLWGKNKKGSGGGEKTQNALGSSGGTSGSGTGTGPTGSNVSGSTTPSSNISGATTSGTSNISGS